MPKHLKQLQVHGVNTSPQKATSFGPRSKTVMSVQEHILVVTPQWGWSTWFMRRGRHSWICSAWRREALLLIFRLLTEECLEHRERHTNPLKQQQGKFTLVIRKEEKKRYSKHRQWNRFHGALSDIFKKLIRAWVAWCNFETRLAIKQAFLGERGGSSYLQRSFLLWIMCWL